MEQEEEEKTVKKDYFPNQARLRAALKRLKSDILTLARVLEKDEEVRAAREYSRKNLGTVFFAVFAVLMILAIAQSKTPTSLSQTLAEYAIAFLLLGVVAQIFSYFLNGIHFNPAQIPVSFLPKNTDEELRWIRGAEASPIFGGKSDFVTPEIILEHLDLLPSSVLSNGYVIDLGMGRRNYAMELAPRILGIDANFGYLSHPPAKEISICATLEGIPVRRNSCSVGLLIDTLEHVRDEEKTFESISNVISPEGYVLITVPNRFFPFEKNGIQIEGRSVQFPGNFGMPFFPLFPSFVREKLERARNYSQKDVVEMVLGHNFEIIQIDYAPFKFYDRGNGFIRAAESVANRICENTPLKLVRPTCIILAKKRGSKGNSSANAT